MATIQVRRGTKAQLDSITLASGELGFTTDTNEVWVGTGSVNIRSGRCLVGLLSARPSAGVSGRFYYATDNGILYADDGSAWQDVSAGGSPVYLSRNSIINGDMRIAQRGTSFAAVATNTYTLDRFTYIKSGIAVHTITQDSSTPNSQFSYSLKLDCTTADASVAAGDFVFVQQRIEGYNFKKFIGQTATLSFWVKAGKTGTMCVGVGNAIDRCYIIEVTINAANTWEKKTVTLTFDYSGGTWNYTNGVGLAVTFCLMAGSTYQTTADAWQSGNYLATSNQTNFCDNTDATCDVWITGVQLELGAVATEFEFLDFSTELAQCQRYYEKSDREITGFSGDTTSGSVYYSFAFYKIVKRTAANPSFINGGASKFGTTSSLQAAATYGFQAYRASNSTGAGGFFFDYYTVDAEL